MIAKPKVSVIVPVYRPGKELGHLIQQLLCQFYRNREIILVNNGPSNWFWRRICEERDDRGSILTFDLGNIANSYAARNYGILQASGDLLAFCDLDATPEPSWLSQLVATMNMNGTGLVAGRVIPTISNSRSIAQRFDASFFLQQKQNVIARRSAATANLMVKRTVFEQVGLFNDAFQSSGDFEFLWRAVGDGQALLVYAEAAVVHHPTRNFWPLMKKCWRVGMGKSQLYRLLGSTSLQDMVRKNHQTKGLGAGQGWQIALMKVLVYLVTGLGFLAGFIALKSPQPKVARLVSKSLRQSA